MTDEELAGACISKGALQKPRELTGLLRMVRELQPKVVVEVGSAQGGTLYGWCRLAVPDALIVSIDLPGGDFGGGMDAAQQVRVGEYAQPGQTLRFLPFDSHSSATRYALTEILAGRKIDLLMIDGDHSYMGVRQDYQMYGELVRDGGLIAFHDVLSHPGFPSCQVDRLWHQIRTAASVTEFLDYEDLAEWGQWGGIGVIRKTGRVLPGVDAPPAKLLATFYAQATPVTTYLRCELPARYLPGKLSREITLVADEEDYWYPDHEGAAILQFGGHWQEALNVHGLQHKGVRVLMESDDNYFTVAPRMRNTGWTKKIGEGPYSLDGHASILKWVDGCIVTTEFLAKQYRKHCDTVYVCPTGVDPLDWPVLEKPDDGVFRIGWFASHSHTEDGRLVRRAMEWASRQKDVEVLTMGYHPPWRFPHRQIPWQNLPEYRLALGLLDVGVAPIVPTAWALCRSDLKALEYTMGGAAAILSDVAPYDLWADGENCLKAKDAGGFFKQVKHLVANRDEARQLAAAAKEHVLRERTTEAQIGLWREAVEG